MSPSPVRVRDVEFRVTDCSSRLPFRFGAATITWAPLVTVRVTAEVDGERAVGYAADLAMPRWFDKHPARSIEDDVNALTASAVAAGAAFLRARTGTAFEVWRRAHVERTGSNGVPLVNEFGVALVERAMLDAVCRASECSFFQGWKQDLFGFRPGAVHSTLEAWDPAASLPEEPLRRVRVRHTVGLVDPLRTADIDPAHRVDDGLPVALEEDVARYGLTAFKLKVGGDLEADVQRLTELAEFLPAAVGDELFVTLDANEQYADLAALRALLERTPPALLDRIAYVEQPFARAASFDTPIEGLSRDVILDEADSGIDAFPRGLELGYRGVSVKNCKGVFRAFLNRGLADLCPGAFQSAEDLTNLPVLSLQQDLATVATLGLPHVERNGHHYFRGLDHLPPAEARSALAAHPELYEERDGGSFLRIERGELDLSSLQGPGYGYSSAIDFEARTPLADWTPVARTRGVR